MLKYIPKSSLPDNRNIPQYQSVRVRDQSAKYLDNLHYQLDGAVVIITLDHLVLNYTPNPSQLPLDLQRKWLKEYKWNCAIMRKQIFAAVVGEFS